MRKRERGWGAKAADPFCAVLSAPGNFNYTAFLRMCNYNILYSILHHYEETKSEQKLAKDKLGFQLSISIMVLNKGSTLHCVKAVIYRFLALPLPLHLLFKGQKKICSCYGRYLPLSNGISPLPFLFKAI